MDYAPNVEGGCSMDQSWMMPSMQSAESIRVRPMMDYVPWELHVGEASMLIVEEFVNEDEPFVEESLYGKGVADAKRLVQLEEVEPFPAECLYERVADCDQVVGAKSLKYAKTLFSLFSEDACNRLLKGVKSVSVFAMDMNADASNDASTVHLPYIEITRENGSIVHHCRATEDCPKRHLCFLKRVHMMHHLSDDHGIQVNIPKRPMGRPKGCNASTTLNSSRSMRQSKTRFTDIDAKIRNAWNKHRRDKEAAAKTFWESLDDDNKPPLDVWRKNYVAEAMARWESRMPARMHRMECAIKLGYEAWPANEPKEDGMIHDVEETKTPTKDESSIDRTPPAPKKAKKAKECDGPSSTPFHTNRQPIFSEKKTASEPIYVPSPEESSVVKDIYLQVSAGKLGCVEDSPKLSSYVARVIVHLRSEKFDLDMDFNVSIINEHEFTNIKASTKTINLI
ncbi:hypothetical protein L7F22_041619 [Adiantum nelumboides]|nr:hypothetical protein [Adiantum nelumboides]